MITITKHQQPELFQLCKNMAKMKTDSQFSQLFHIDEQYIKWTNAQALLRADIEILRTFHDTLTETSIKPGFYKAVKEDSNTFILLHQDTNIMFPDVNKVIPSDISVLNKVSEYAMTAETLLSIVPAIFSNLDNKTLYSIDPKYAQLAIDLNLTTLRLTKPNCPLFFTEDNNITLVVMPKIFAEFKYNDQDYSKVVW